MPTHPNPPSTLLYLQVWVVMCVRVRLHVSVFLLKREIFKKNLMPLCVRVCKYYRQTSVLATSAAWYPL